jgi:myo-inositol-1(or 4)-monophosphatase
MYVAERGKGAYVNGKRIHVSKRKRLIDCYCLYDSAFTRLGREIIEGIKLLKDHIFGFRMFGCAGQCFGWLASGRGDIYIEYKTTPWDIASGAVIVEEAGGRITTHEGKPWTIASRQFVASNGIVHNRVVKLI